MTNDSIAHSLDKIAFFLSLQEDNETKVKAYQKAAQYVRDFPEPLEEVLINGQDLTVINGIGRVIAKRIEELIVLGEKQCLKSISGPYPETLFELAAVKGLSPRTIMRLFQNHHIHSLADLRAALRSNQALDLPPACKHALDHHLSK
jgi:DNA polymerase (family X)